MTTPLADTIKDLPLRIGITTRALFNLEEEHHVFTSQGVHAYTNLQRDRENEILKPGTGFPVISRLMNLNKKGSSPLVEVILLSKNSPDLSLRAFKSIEYYDLSIKTGSFTSGNSVAPFIPAWNIDLFLSNDQHDVQQAVKAGTAAAKLGKIPNIIGPEIDEVRIAFDGDAVVFSHESDQIYKDHGLDAFLRHETENSKSPMNVGPFGKFLRKLSELRGIYLKSDGTSKVRIAIVTARNAPAHERVVRTLRAWNTPADEAHFVGTHPKAPILEAIGAHIFFDDQEKHILGASEFVPSGHVPGPHDSNYLVIPAA